MDNPLLQILSGIMPVSPELRQDFNNCLFSRTIRRKQILLKSGRDCDQMYFVVKGLLRAYYYDQKEEITNWFMREGDFAISIHSFYLYELSTETIQALEDCELLYISRADLDALYLKYVELNIAGRKITSEYMCRIEARYKAIRKTTALERYQNLMRTRPDLISRVANQYIATYLGMNMETLSRLKRQLMQ